GEFKFVMLKAGVSVLDVPFQRYSRSNSSFLQSVEPDNEDTSGHVAREVESLTPSEIDSAEDLQALSRDSIEEIDPEDITFTEYEIKLSDTWQAFLLSLAPQTAKCEVACIRENENQERTFYCSGRP